MPVEQQRGLRRHERILDAAVQTFSRHGYHATAVEDIANAAETSKGGVYFHFPNKEAIFLALLDRMAGLLRSRVEAAIAAEPHAIRRLELALQYLLHTFATHRTLARIFLVDALGSGQSFEARLATIRRDFAGMIHTHLADAVQAGIIPDQNLDLVITSQVWFGALNEVVTTWVLTEPPGQLEDAYPVLRKLLLSSVGVSPDQPTGAVP